MTEVGGDETTIHGVALALAVDADGPRAGVLVLGPAGAGKSALALDLIHTCPWRRSALVADDVVILETRFENGSRIVQARAPQPIAGRIEARGFGPVSAPTAGLARLVVGFDLAATPERVPAPGAPAGFRVSDFPVYPFRLDAPAPAARLRAAVRSILVDKSNDARTIADC